MAITNRIGCNEPTSIRADVHPIATNQRGLQPAGQNQIEPAARCGRAASLCAPFEIAIEQRANFCSLGDELFDHIT